MRYSPATHAIAVIVGDGHATTTTPAPMEKIPANATSPRAPQGAVPSRRQPPDRANRAGIGTEEFV
jgi:hypothetical protein